MSMLGVTSRQVSECRSGASGCVVGQRLDAQAGGQRGREEEAGGGHRVVVIGGDRQAVRDVGIASKSSAAMIDRCRATPIIPCRERLPRVSAPQPTLPHRGSSVDRG